MYHCCYWLHLSAWKKKDQPCALKERSVNSEYDNTLNRSSSSAGFPHCALKMWTRCKTTTHETRWHLEVWTDGLTQGYDQCLETTHYPGPFQPWCSQQTRHQLKKWNDNHQISMQDWKTKTKQTFETTQNVLKRRKKMCVGEGWGGVWWGARWCVWYMTKWTACKGVHF